MNHHITSIDQTRIDYKLYEHVTYNMNSPASSSLSETMIFLLEFRGVEKNRSLPFKVLGSLADCGSHVRTENCRLNRGRSAYVKPMEDEFDEFRGSCSSAYYSLRDPSSLWSKLLIKFLTI